uniref:Transporter n=1 Tax=Phallusia mammillata TaxID=59560 RepID=A0A6F9DS90_9ASCI|nr:sodium-dependent neutral amino acid transporter B(0)AT2 [Phallusia mammillata]
MKDKLKGHHHLEVSIEMSPNPHNNLSQPSEIIASNKDLEASEKIVDSDGSISSDKKEKPRPQWDNKFQYLMAALGFAVGLGNIWRFPYLCKKNGGGAFLIPYLVMLVLEGYPLYYLELAVGQKIRKGTIGVWLHINPYLGGIGFASNVVCLLIGLYYNMILGWASFYLYNSFQSPLPWASCPMINGTIPVHECNVSSPTNYFWYRETLDISNTIDSGSELNWRMVLVLFIAWVIVFLGMNKGIKSSGKVMYFATLFPYTVLIAFFIRGMTLDGAVDGVKYMFSPDITKLADANVWRDAATQIFFSLGLGYGTIIAYSSYTKANNNCQKDAVFVASANCLTSIFACVTIFSILGFKAKNKTLECMEQNQHRLREELNSMYEANGEVFSQLERFYQSNSTEQFYLTTGQTWTFMEMATNCSLKKELDNNVGGTGLAFIAFTEAVLKFPGAPFWAVLFFFMLLCIGMSSEFGILQTVITTALDAGCKIPKTVLTAIMCSCMFVVGLIFTQRSGSYFLDIFDSYSATLALVSIALCEVLSVSYIYGMNRFEKDLKEMVGSYPNLYWRISWRITCPLALAVILVASIVGLAMEPPAYKGWNENTGTKVPLTFPGWAMFLIVMVILLSLLFIPLIAILYHKRMFDPKIFGAKTSGGRKEATGNVTESCQPLTAKET